MQIDDKKVKAAAKKIKPFGDRVLVLADDPEKVSPGGIIIPQMAQEDKRRLGTILAVGKGEHVDDLKVGDHVFFNHYGHFDLELDKIEFGIVDGEEIRAVLHD